MSLRDILRSLLGTKPTAEEEWARITDNAIQAAKAAETSLAEERAKWKAERKRLGMEILNLSHGDDAAEARWFTGAEVPLSDLSDLASAKEIRYWAHVATETRPTAAPAPLTETEARTWALALEAKLGLDCPSFPGAYTDPLTAALLASNRGEIPSDVRTLNPPGAEGAVADRPLPPAERRELAAEMAIRAIEDTPPPYHAVWPTYDDGSDHDPKGGA